MNAPCSSGLRNLSLVSRMGAVTFIAQRSTPHQILLPSARLEQDSRLLVRHLHHGAMVDAYDGNDHVDDDDDDDDDVLVYKVYVGYSDSDKDHDVGAASGVSVPNVGRLHSW